MAKSKSTYEVKAMDQEGVVTTQVLEGSDDVPKKGDSFEYEHREVRVAQVIEVIEVDADGNRTELTELGDTHHALVVEVEDEPVDLAHVDDDATANA